MRLVLVFALVGCSAARPSVAPAQPERRALSLETAERLWVRDPSRPRDAVGFLELDEDILRAIWRNIRIEVRGDEVAMAPLGVGMLEAARCGSRWLFASDEGFVASARTFLGDPLQRESKRAEWLVGGARTTLGSHRNRLVEIECGDEMRISPTEIVGASLQPRVRGQNAYVVAPMGFFRRAREGESLRWERVDLGEEAAQRLVEDGNALLLQTSAGFLDAATLRSVSPSLPIHPAPLLTPDEEARVAEMTPRVFRAIEERFPHRKERWIGYDAVARTRGESTTVRILDGEPRILEGCKLTAHGPFVLCGNVLRQLRVDHDQIDLVTVVTFEEPPEGRLYVLDPDTLLVRPRSGVDALLVQTGTLESTVVVWRDRSVAGRVRWPSSIAEGHALIFDGETWTLINDGRAETLATPMTDDEYPIIDANGTVWVLQIPGFGQPPEEYWEGERYGDRIDRIRRIDADGEVVLSLPDGEFAHFVVRREGIFLVGVQPDQLWYSRDGATWSRVPPDPRIDGEIPAGHPRSVPIARGRYCPPGPCNVNERFVLSKDAPRALRNETMYGPTRAQPPMRAEPTPGDTIECETEENPLPAETGHYGLVSVSGRRVRWRGMDAQGSFRGSARLPQPVDDCRLLSAMRGSAVLACESQLYLAQEGSALELGSVRGFPEGRVLQVSDTEGAGVFDEGRTVLAVGWTQEGVTRSRFGWSRHAQPAFVAGEPAIAWFASERVSGWPQEGHVMRLTSERFSSFRVRPPLQPCSDPARTSDSFLYLSPLTDLSIEEAPVRGFPSEDDWLGWVRGVVVRQRGDTQCAMSLDSGGVRMSIDDDRFAGLFPMALTARRVRVRRTPVLAPWARQLREFESEAAGCGLSSQDRQVHFEVRPGPDPHVRQLGDASEWCLRRVLYDAFRGDESQTLLHLDIEILHREPTLTPLVCGLPRLLADRR
ncbi:MAG: hypothetical protein AAGE52_21865 [Myxococcota bacterium]